MAEDGALSFYKLLSELLESGGALLHGLPFLLLASREPDMRRGFWFLCTCFFPEKDDHEFYISIFLLILTKIRSNLLSSTTKK